MTRPLKILLVEDNPDDAELALVALRAAGFAPDWHRASTRRRRTSNSSTPASTW